MDQIDSDCRQYAYTAPGTYYLLVEGDGIIRLHIGTYVYSDCPDAYTPVPNTYALEFFPNPAVDMVQIKLSDEDNTETKTVIVYNKSNMPVKRVEIKGSEVQLSVSDLPADIYIVDIITRYGSR